MFDEVAKGTSQQQNVPHFPLPFRNKIGIIFYPKRLDGRPLANFDGKFMVWDVVSNNDFKWVGVNGCFKYNSHS